jgi:hypothetical protein
MEKTKEQGISSPMIEKMTEKNERKKEVLFLLKQRMVDTFGEQYHVSLFFVNFRNKEKNRNETQTSCQHSCSQMTQCSPL